MLPAYYTDAGGRAANEDTVLLRTNEAGSLCLVVADGLGGHGGGDVAGRAAARAVCEGWTGTGSPSLAELCDRAQEAVLALQTPQCSMKTTLVVLSVAGNHAEWLHVGDSRLYRFYNGSLRFQTRDHSASQLAVMLGDITPDMIRFHPARARLLRALGQEGGAVPECSGMDLGPGRHAFLLCTDGFWEYVLEAEMAETLAASADPEEWLGRMRAILDGRVKGDNDNNTAAAVWIDV